MSHSKGYKWVMSILILGLLLGLILPWFTYYGSTINYGTFTGLDLKIFAILPMVTILILIIYSWADKPSPWLWPSLILTILSLVGFIFMLFNIDSFLMIGGWLMLFSLIVVLFLLVFRRRLAFDMGRGQYRDAMILKEKLDAIHKIESPCVISIYRPSSLTGGESPFIAYLHDVKIGEIENGKTFSFSTYYATNTIKLVLEDDGTIIEETFPAEAGGSLRFKLNLPEGTLEENKWVDKNAKN
jgi:hypothetical protein